MKQFKISVFENTDKKVLEDTYLIDAENVEDAIKAASDLDGIIEERISAELAE